MTEAQKEYIITEERLKNLICIVYRDGGVKMDDDIHDALKGIHSRPYKSDAVLDDLYNEYGSVVLIDPDLIQFRKYVLAVIEMKKRELRTKER